MRKSATRIRLALACAFIWIAWVWFWVEYGGDFDLKHRAFLHFLALGFGLVISGLVLGVWKRHWRTFLAGVTVLPLCISGVVVGGLIHEWQVSRAETDLRPTMAALDDFRKQHGRYPARLAELVPRHLPAVPHANFGRFDRELTYYGRGGNSYYLAFDEWPGLDRIFDSRRRGGWYSNGR